MAAKTASSEKHNEKAREHDADLPEAASVSPDTTTTTASTNSKGGGRKRKRHLFNSIRGQMEFYFGDANLSKDRFLRRYVEQDPYVPLDIFLTFNKIKMLTQDVHQISTSLSNSQLLELDESGLKVRRRTALPEQRDVNDKTLYVEALPATATHDWLKEVFSRYGPVAYVSLPHYPGTKKIKQFAFIEFEKCNGVEKAMKAFAQVQGVLSVENTNPADLVSVRSFQQQQQLIQKTNSSQTVAQDVATEKTNTSKAANKREADKETTHEGVAAKRVKLEQQNQSGTSDAETTDAEAAQHSETDNNGDKTAAKKQKRRRKQTKRVKPEKQGPNIEPSALELKVLPKTSWCSLRNKYLNLQRRMISEAKSKLWRSAQTQQPPSKCNMQTQLQAQQQQLAESKGSCNSGTSSGHEENEPLSDDGDTGVEVPVPAKRRKRNKNAGVHRMNMNFYGAGGSEADDSRLAARTEDAVQERSPLFKYEPGLIVECALHEPCTSIKEFKADMRQYPDIKYVDIKEGDQLAHLRMATPDAAEQLTRQISCAEMQLKVLRGQPETQYWRKIEQDREAKLTKKVRVQQKRGREKVSKLLAKHIKFVDDEVTASAGGAAPEPNTTVNPADVLS